MKTILPVLFALLLIPVVASAQDEACPDLVQNAYDVTQEVCKSLGDDEACYGNLTIVAEPGTLAFSEPGDLAGVAEIDSLRLTSMSVDTEEWGISLIHVGALGAEGDAPQTVELVLFGNVEIANAAEEDSGLAPMQAFTFTSGVDDRPCDEAPDSGIMIQTPAGVGEITLLVNEVTIDLGSTAYLQAEPGNEMAIHIVDGEGQVSTGGATMMVPEGAWARVPLDEDGLSDGPAEGPLPYDEDSLQSLPVPLLTEQIAIAPAIEDDKGEAEGSVQNDGDNVPIAGTWNTNDCEGDFSVLTIAVNGDELIVDDGESVGTFVLTEPGSYLYTIADGQDISEFGYVVTFQLISENRMESIFTGFGESCSLIFTR